MSIDFTGQHRIRIGGQDSPLYDFVVHPVPAATIPPAGIALGVEEAMRAAGPPPPQSYSVETVTFGCTSTLEHDKSYDYFSPQNQQRQLKILNETHRLYRGVFQ